MSSASSSDSTQYAETHEQLENPPEESINGGDAKPASRFLWPKMNKSLIVVDGKKFSGYRFLQDSNKVDRIFVDVMHEIEPFLGKHGEISNLWEQVAAECKKRNPTLFREFDSRNAKFRLEAYKKFVTTMRAQDKRDSGNDDKQPPTDLLNLIENLVDKKNSFDDGRKEKKIQNDNRKKDKEVAASVRMAALGCHVKKVANNQPPPVSSVDSTEKIDVDEDDDFSNGEGGDLVVDDDDDESYEAATKKAKSSNIDPPPTSNKTINNSNKRRQSFGDEHNARVSNIEEKIAETNKIFAESKKQKVELEERRMNMEAEANNKKFDLEQKRINLEDRRLKLEESRAETDRVRAEADKEDRKTSHELMLQMLTMMKTMQENMNSKK
jgi:hypothetical protein